MSYREPARTAARRARSSSLAALVMGGAALFGVLAWQSLASSSLSAASPLEFLHGDGRPDTGTESELAVPGDLPRQADQDEATVFDDEAPAVAKLDPALLAALRRAATDAAHDGVVPYVDSGWRSPAYQQQLLRDAISKYGSEEEAARWVATPNTSAHVSGDAVDIGPSEALPWMSKRGAEYGLCQIYRNEPWHYELRPEASKRGCPRMYADPTHDPRMQR